MQMTNQMTAGIAELEMNVAASSIDLREWAVLLDIDGTILDIAPTPREVWVPPALRHTLAQIDDMTGGALALVSGRSLNDIDLIFAPLQLAAIGGHGAEFRPAGDAKVQLRTGALSPDLKRRLATVTELGPGILVEDKGYSLALHYRLAPERGLALIAMVNEICAGVPPGLIEILPGKFVVEVKATGVNKAVAVVELMKHPPFLERRPIFIGDDTTDEPVFGVIPKFGGLGFSVGRVVPGVNGHFATPESVRSWLSRIIADREGATG